MNTITSHQQIATARISHLTAELTTALAAVEKVQLQQWALASAKLWPTAVARRLVNMGRLVKAVGNSTYAFAKRAHNASKDGRLADHLAGEAQGAYRDVSEWVVDTATNSAKVVQALRQNPGEVAPDLLILVLTSLVVSGGPDGDGGAPDLDLMAGIGAHRSPLTHSIILGSALETGIFAALTLVDLVHDKLPAQRDPWWDLAHSWSARIATQAARGASIGMAYHLFVDGLLQPGTYHDLPISMPLEGHEALFVLNAKLEALDVPNKEAAVASARSNARTTTATSPRAPQSASEGRDASTSPGPDIAAAPRGRSPVSSF